MYHGTEKIRGQKMVNKGRMEYSRSTEAKQHWLGDGIYLYKDCFYAFRWIVLMFRNRHKTENIDDLFIKYSILSLDVDYSNERVFSMINPDHFIVFNKVKTECEKKRGYSKQFEMVDIIDGIIFNIMFKSMNYGNYYDIVEAVFPIDYIEDGVKTRIKTLNEYQMCIKNPDIIKNIIDYSDKVDYNLYYKKLNDFENFRRSIRTTYKYRT